MRKVKVRATRLLKRNKSIEGLSIEQQMRAVMTGEKIDLNGKAMIYTERGEGVVYQTNIRSIRIIRKRQRGNVHGIKQKI